MSIIIEGMDMPKCCGSCEFNNGYRCTRTETVIDRDYEYQERLSDCPLHESELKEWIHVCERLPEDEEYVLGCYANGLMRTMYFYFDTEVYPTEFADECETGWYDGDENFLYDQDVIAWMPLPEPFKAEREG